MGDQWYYESGGTWVGPVSAEYLRTAVNAGQLLPTTQVRLEGIDSDLTVDALIQPAEPTPDPEPIMHTTVADQVTMPVQPVPDPGALRTSFSIVVAMLVGVLTALVAVPFLGMLGAMVARFVSTPGGFDRTDVSPLWGLILGVGLGLSVAFSAGASTLQYLRSRLVRRSASAGNATGSH